MNYKLWIVIRYERVKCEKRAQTEKTRTNHSSDAFQEREEEEEAELKHKKYFEKPDPV